MARSFSHRWQAKVRQLLFLLTCIALTGSKAPRELTVFAAASLVEILPQVLHPWAEKHNVKLIFNFDGTSRLARQIEQGASADIFVSANRDWILYLEGNGKVTAESRRVVMGNALVLVGRDKALQIPQDIRRLGVAGENVPAGIYAQEALTKMGWWNLLAPKVVRGHHVRTVLRWAEKGDVDAAVVYRTDALASTQQNLEVLYTFPSHTHAAIQYLAARTTGADSFSSELLQYLVSDEAQKMFATGGFVKAGRP